MNNKKILEVTKDVKWIGVLDFDIVTFDIVMETKYGTTYNSYFINAKKKAVVETVKEKFKDVYFEKLVQLTNPADIEYIICNHTEPDHSGSVKHLLEIAPNATVVGSGQAINYLTEMIAKPFKSMKVKDGDIIDLGNKKLRVIGAPNLHWPDSIYTYLEEDKILFTCDSFGAHFCDEEMYDDKVGDYTDAFKYYFDVILKPFSKFMLKAIEKIRPLDITAICTGHGPVLRSTWKEKVALSEKYSNLYLADCEGQKPVVLVAYVSAYGFTGQMAEQIAEGIKSEGGNPEVVDIENILLGDLDEKLVKSKGIVLGSPTINQNTLLPVYKMFALINPIRDKGKLAASFGSYGWSGEAVGIIDANLKALKLKLAFEGKAAKFVPYNGKAEDFVNFGKEFAKQLVAEQA
ncbi:MAG: FprA family A-type flavoprotein [Bacteroidales bacterium]|nr:FprA family A-type flavoprotein [Bacteroidales bacterium]